MKTAFTGSATWLRRTGMVAAITAGPMTAAQAADWYTGAAPPRPNSDWIVSLDSSATVTSTSRFAAASTTFALDRPLTQSGPRLRVEALAGTYRFDAASGASVKGDQLGGALLAGYQWVSPRSSFAIYGGGAVRASQFSGPAIDLPAAGTSTGFKTSFEYFATPTDRTMLFAYGSYSTIYNAYYTRAKLGIATFGSAYVGPEVAALGDDFYRQWRIGAHVTGLQMGGLQFGLSGGYEVDRQGKSGAYGVVDMRAVY
jgi:hypothetical protein